jgi:hypothetical protein
MIQGEFLAWDANTWCSTPSGMAITISLQTPVKALPVDWLAIGDQGTVWLQKWSEEVWHKKKS